jgi:hypothetical protein
MVPGAVARICALCESVDRSLDRQVRKEPFDREVVLKLKSVRDLVDNLRHQTEASAETCPERSRRRPCEHQYLHEHAVLRVQMCCALQLLQLKLRHPSAAARAWISRRLTLSLQDLVQPGGRLVTLQDAEESRLGSLRAFITRGRRSIELLSAIEEELEGHVKVLNDGLEALGKAPIGAGLVCELPACATPAVIPASFSAARLLCSQHPRVAIKGGPSSVRSHPRSGGCAVTAVPCTLCCRLCIQYRARTHPRCMRAAHAAHTAMWYMHPCMLGGLDERMHVDMWPHDAAHVRVHASHGRARHTGHACACKALKAFSLLCPGSLLVAAVLPALCSWGNLHSSEHKK